MSLRSGKDTRNYMRFAERGGWGTSPTCGRKHPLPIMQKRLNAYKKALQAQRRKVAANAPLTTLFLLPSDRNQCDRGSNPQLTPGPGLRGGGSPECQANRAPQIVQLSPRTSGFVEC